MRSLGLVVGLAALTACDDGGQTGDEGAHCDPVESTTLGLDDDSPLGFSGADVLAVAGGEHTSTLRWAIGGTTALTVDVVHDGTVKFVEYEWVDDSGQDIAALDCGDQLELGVTVSFATADGAFDESFVTRLDAVAGDAASLFEELDLDDLTGTYEVTTETDTSDYDDVTAWLTVDFAAAGWSGTVEGQGSGTDGSGPDGTAYAEGFDIAEWPAP